MLAPATTFGLELGEASIKSGLGQALRVEIPYRLAASERLTPACITLVPAANGAGALPSPTRASRISVSATHIEIFDAGRVLEPLIGLTVDVHCSTAPHFVRSYELFVDPPIRAITAPSDDVRLAGEVRGARRVDAQASVAAAEPRTDAEIHESRAGAVTTRARSTESALANSSPRARGQAGGDLAQGQEYRVVRGDTLSGIAARIADRPGTLREAADAIFAANPRAFIRGNRDLIAEGRSLVIPILATLAPTPTAEPAQPSTAELAPLRSAQIAQPPAPASFEPSAALPVEQQHAARAAAVDATRPVPAAAVVETSAPSLERPENADGAAEVSTSSTARRTSTWLVVVVALGVVALLSAPLVFVRRRKRQPEPEPRAASRKSPPRKLLDPAAGIEVVESRAPRGTSDDRPIARSVPDVEPVTEPGAASPPGLEDLALPIGPTDAVDLDVGAPVTIDERVDWFGGRVSPWAAPVGRDDDETIEDDAATARMQDLRATADADARRPASKPDAAEQAVDDDQMTLTIVELEMLRRDYEAEHTLTQEANKALRDAVADLKATQAARAAALDTSTLEVLQPSQADVAEDSASIKTARVRMK